MSLSLDNPYWRALADEHLRWLQAYDGQYVTNWEKLLKANSEAALCEAGVRRRLQVHGVAVEPNERLTGNCGGPDFRCRVNESKFYVEATCVLTSTLEARTGVRDDLAHVKIPPFTMTEAVFDECVSKATQCANLDAPALVAVGTFHAWAAMVGFRKCLIASVLTGTTKIAWNVDMANGKRSEETFQLTEFEHAAFLKPDETREFDFARSSISGLLLCGLGTEPGHFLGVLHPNPVRPFNPALLPDVDLGQVTLDRPSRTMHVLWSRGEND